MAARKPGERPAEHNAEGLSEADSDRRWASLAAAAATARNLESLGAALQNLLRERAAIERKYKVLQSSTGWTAQHEDQRNAALDPMSECLHDLAFTMAKLPAATLEQQRLKAIALAELCEEHSDDVVHRLAASLASDLLRAGPA